MEHGTEVTISFLQRVMLCWLTLRSTSTTFGPNEPKGKDQKGKFQQVGTRTCARAKEFPLWKETDTYKREMNCSQRDIKGGVRPSSAQTNKQNQGERRRACTVYSNVHSCLWGRKRPHCNAVGYTGKGSFFFTKEGKKVRGAHLR